MITPPAIAAVPFEAIVISPLTSLNTCSEPDTIPLPSVMFAKDTEPPNAVELPTIEIVLLVIPVPSICAEPETTSSEFTFKNPKESTCADDETIPVPLVLAVL